MLKITARAHQATRLSLRMTSLTPYPYCICAHTPITEKKQIFSEFSKFARPHILIYMLQANYVIRHFMKCLKKLVIF